MPLASPENDYLYNPSLKEKAQELRSSMTKSEAVMWKHVLRGRQMLGFSFNRQRPVMGYIVDFMCRELMLIIEVDGVSHLVTEMGEKDRARQDALEQAGFTVIRFTSSQVLEQLADVKSAVQRQCEVLMEERGKV